MSSSASILPLYPQPKKQADHNTKLREYLKTVNRHKIVKLRAKKTKSGYTFLLEYFKNNQRVREYLKIYYSGLKENARIDNDNLKLALRIRDRHEIKFHEDKYNFQLYDKKQDILLIKYIEGIISQLTRKDSPWMNTLKHLKKYTPAGFSIGRVDRAYCEGFKNYLLKHPDIKSRNTAHVYFSVLKATLNRAIREQIIYINPAQQIQISKQETRRDFLTIEEIKKLKDTPCMSEQTKRAFLFSCFTGLRFSDIKKITWENIQDGYINYQQQKTKGMERMKLSKNALEIIESQKRGRKVHAGKVFNVVTANCSNDHIRRWARDAGINKKITWHCGRHTFATLCLSAGNDIYTVSKLLGHKDVKVTQIYARLIDSKKDEAIDRLPTI